MKRPALAVCILSCLCASLVIVHPSSAENMVSMKGAYGVSSGFESKGYMWKDANADYQEKNWQYIFGPDTVNTYDPRIFDRFQTQIETHTGTPWNAGCLIKVDPWSFVGVANQTMISQTGPGLNANESFQIKYKYWGNTGRTIPERVRGNQGQFINIPEIKVVDQRVSQTNALLPATPSTIVGTLSPGNSAELDYMFRPLRKIWLEYKEDPLYVKFFPISDMHEALYSDDPMRLSNNKVYWAPSPWLWNFDPGILMTSGRVQQAKWNWDLPWYSEDSNRNYLTFLRGATIGYKFHNKATVDFTVAAPMSLWDDFDAVTSVPMAGRFKMYPSENMVIGATYTAKYGIYKSDLCGNNQVFGTDFDYNLGEETHLFGECAASRLYMKQPNEQQYTITDTAYKIGAKSKAASGPNKFFGDVAFTYMGPDFSPGLADYRDTRIDRDWGEHIWFDPIPKEDAAIRIGDSVDVNRIVIGANGRASLADNLVNIFVNVRNVHAANLLTGQSPRTAGLPGAITNASPNDSQHYFIENVTRGEVEYNPLKNLQLKGLALYKARPRALQGYDPILRDRYTDQPYANPSVQDGRNADTMTFGGGAKVDFFDKRLSIFGIYEATNEPQDFPRKELYNPGQYYHIYENIKCQDMYYNMYSQNLFSLPDYQFFNIWKGVVTVTPVDQLTIRYTHVTNTNLNYAPLIDDNHNHDSIEVTYVVTKKLTVLAGYSYSRVINLATAVNTGGRERFFEPHSNIYGQGIYTMTKDTNLIVQFGEFGLLQENLGIFGLEDPGMGYLSSRQGVLDTRGIIRVFYQGKF